MKLRRRFLIAICGGVKVFLTLNTLLTDRELAGAAQEAAQASAMGVDAVLVQDLGGAADASADGARPAGPRLHPDDSPQPGRSEAVRRPGDEPGGPLPELSRDQIEYICARSPVEIEVFAHGALCMCYSGQCFFSSVIGGRSGNRGCAPSPAG